MSAARFFERNCRIPLRYVLPAVCLLLAVSPLACSSHDCGPERRPPAGSPDDMLTAPGVYDGFAVQAARRCDDQRTILTIAGLGLGRFGTYGMACADPAALDAGVPDACGTTINGLLDEVSVRLGAQGVEYPLPIPTTGQAPCDGFELGMEMFLHLQRWQDADLAIAAVGAVLRERGLGETVAAMVEPATVACAQ